MSRVPTNTTFLATGNNLTFRGDMSTRAVMCKLLPKAERPEERQYGWDARAETRAARPRLVAAALTIIRAYVVAGRPGMDRKPFGRFEHWQAMIQDPLLWLGAPDPCKTRELGPRLIKSTRR
jgi:putative DNA primase/helicase